MRYRVLGIFVLSSALLASSCSHSQDWNGRVFESNGALTVSNPEIPLYRSPIFDLKEEITYGNKDEFPRIKFEVSDSGAVYVLDLLEKSVHAFDPFGRAAGIFGRKGQGPGEFERPAFIESDSLDEIVICDTDGWKLIFFSKAGAFIKSISLSKIGTVITDFQMSTSDHLVFGLSHNPWSLEIRKYDGTLSQSAQIAALERKDHRDGKIDLRMPSLEFAIDPRGQIVWGQSDQYKLSVLDQDGLLKKTIIKEQTVSAFPAYEKKKLEAWFSSKQLSTSPNMIVFPEHCPAFDSLTIDEQGRIYVLVYGPTEKNVLEVFSKEGIYLGNGNLPLTTNGFKIKNGKLFAITDSSTGFPTLKRYELNWKIEERDLSSLFDGKIE